MPRPDRKTLLLALSALGLAGGGAAWALGRPALADPIWTLATLPVLAALLAEIVGGLRRGQYGLDIVAALSMSAALVFGEQLAAAVVALMYSGGTFLELFAERRARREMHALLDRVPRSAMRRTVDALAEVPLDAVAPGDLLLIRRGEVLPVDGTVEGPRAVLDQSALTGEAMPVMLSNGAAAMSGALNAGDPFDLRATRPAADSTYAGIVRLVAEAQASKAPMSRMADRYAMGFLAVTVALSGAAWAVSGDPIRAVAVLVVATPCPLILAVPVALVAGLSRAARYGVLIKGAGALERMSRVRCLVLDKTGTLTDGRPRIVRIDTAPGVPADEVLRLAASLDQLSKHPTAQAIVAAAQDRALPLSVPETASETPGEGMAGRVDGRAVAVGACNFVRRRAAAGGALGGGDIPAGAAVAALQVDGRIAGRIVMADPLREGAADMLEALRGLGLERLVLATGDRRAVAEALASRLNLDAVHADLEPRDKVALVVAEQRSRPVMMVGDGVNDAPALAAADVGVAMGARGAAASAEAANVVLLVDRLDRLLPGIEIAIGARRIALQSVVAGLGLSAAGMLAAAFGAITPVQGALLQEVIDVAVVLNALRVLRIRPATVRGGS